MVAKELARGVVEEVAVLLLLALRLVAVEELLTIRRGCVKLWERCCTSTGLPLEREAA